MKALLLLTSILAISSPSYGTDFFAVTQNPFLADHKSEFFKETESPIRNESILQLQTKGTFAGNDIKTFINNYNFIAFADEQFENYFSDIVPYKTTYFNIKVQSVVSGNVTATILYEETYSPTNIPFSISSLNGYGVTYIDYSNATKNYISSLSDSADYHFTINYYFPIKNFAYPSQIGDEITSFVFDVYFTNSQYYAYTIDQNYNDGYDDGLNQGYVDGYNDGYDDGLIDSPVVNEELGGFFLILRQGFNSIAGILAIQIFPGFTLGLLLFIPLIFGIAYTLIKFLLGGG